MKIALAISSILLLLFIILMSSYFFVPNYLPSIGLRYSPILSIYLRSTNSMALHNVPLLFDTHLALREQWLGVTKSKYGSVEDDLYSLAIDGDPSEKRMAVYVLQCTPSIKAGELLAKLTTSNDVILKDILTHHPKSLPSPIYVGPAYPGSDGQLHPPGQ